MEKTTRTSKADLAAAENGTLQACSRTCGHSWRTRSVLPSVLVLMKIMLWILFRPITHPTAVP